MNMLNVIDISIICATFVLASFVVLIVDSSLPCKKSKENMRNCSWYRDGRCGYGLFRCSRLPKLVCSHDKCKPNKRSYLKPKIWIQRSLFCYVL